MLNSLNIAQTGLNTSKVSLENVTNNIANENTPGYKKRTVDVSEIAHIHENSTGRGSLTGSILRSTSEYLYSNILAENTKESQYQELSTILSDVEAIFKETDDAGLSKSLDAYFKAIEDLNANRDDAVFISNYKDKAQTLVNNMKAIYEGIETRESVAFENAQLDVEEINGILKEIGEINKKIGNQTIPTNDLLDRRDLLEKKLSSFVNVAVEQTEPYELTISGQRAVWHDNVRTYSIGQEHTAQRDKYIDENTLTNSLDAQVSALGFDADDKFVFSLNNTQSVSVTFGEHVLDTQGNILDINGDGVGDASDIVDGTNYIRALTQAINADPYMNKMVQVYNGDYTKDIDGNKIAPDFSVDRHLVIEAKNAGVQGRFETTLEFKKQDTTNGLTNNIAFEPNAKQSTQASNDVYLQSNDTKVEIAHGSLQAKLENLSTNSGDNKFQKYKDLLDNMAFTLSDIHSAYASNSDGKYMYGQDAFLNVGTDIQNIKQMNLFSGSSVKTLEFNDLAVGNLDQMDLDYMTTFQWKNDFSFNNSTQNPQDMNAMSFASFYQELQVGVSSDKENTDFMLDSQKSVVQSLSNTYDEIVKVDKDEEMLNLVKFQAAYEASAKIITIVDQMLQTLIGLKR
jgi:flagellar hook-associated protein 1 FlgK